MIFGVYECIYRCRIMLYCLKFWPFTAQQCTLLAALKCVMLSATVDNNKSRHFVTF